MGMHRQLIVLRLLADAAGRPAAIHVAPAGPAGLPEDLLSSPEMAGLSEALPCVVDAGDAPQAVPACCRILPPDAILAVASLPPSLPPGVLYLVFDGETPASGSTGKTGSRAQALRLAQLVATDADTREIEEVFRVEPTLAYHLLRLVNSPGVSAGRHITSFAQAILILGRKQLRRWLNLLLFSAAKDDPRAPMLLARASFRARSAELLAKEAGYDRDGQESAFMVGMFSLLGVMFGMPLAEVIAPLRLDPAISAALLRREGELGALLSVVEAAEAGDPAAVAAHLDTLLPAAVDFDRLRIEACRWMLELLAAGGAG